METSQTNHVDLNAAHRICYKTKSIKYHIKNELHFSLDSTATNWKIVIKLQAKRRTCHQTASVIDTRWTHSHDNERSRQNI